MRKCNDFINTFTQYYHASKLPETFRPYCSIAAISAVLGRRVWIHSPAGNPDCLPNLYIGLIAPPGVGKDVGINKVATILRLAADKALPRQIARVGSDNLSHKGFIDELAEDRSRQTFMHKGKNYEFHSINLFLGEFSDFMPKYDDRVAPLLASLFTGKAHHQDKVRGLEVNIVKPHVSMLFGNQPATLERIFPLEVFQMGLPSRFIMVFSDEVKRAPNFILPPDQKPIDLSKLEDDLASDLVDMSHMAGPFKVPHESGRMLDDFDMTRPDQVPGAHFIDYNTRRPLHLQKLSAICSASESNSQVIEPHHVERAMQILYDAEKTMPHIFDNVVSARGFTDTFELLEKLAESSSFITHHQLSKQLARTRPPHEVREIIKNFLAGGNLKLKLNAAGVEEMPKTYQICSPTPSAKLRSVK
jgi:hypothetical protein